MKLEQQVISLEYAKRLKKLGVKQESIAYWKGNKLFCCCESTLHSKENETFCAFTVAELGEMLPTHICDREQLLSKTPKKCFSLWQKGVEEDYTNNRKAVEFQCGYGNTEAKTGYEKTEANARAKMLIYLLENNLIKVE